MGKLKQNLPPGASPDNDLFLAMFLIRLQASMRETVGAGDLACFYKARYKKVDLADFDVKFPTQSYIFLFLQKCLAHLFVLHTGRHKMRF
jgi:hypothetical protein